MLGGPVGAVLGQVTGYAIGETVAWLASMAYAPLEGAKVQDALAGAEEALSLRAEDEFRNDGFFESADGGRPPVVEFFEASIRAAARDYEARKAAYLGRFWANLGYEREIDFQRAAFLLRVAGDLTYRQLVLLAIFTRADAPELEARLTALNAETGDDSSTVSPDCAAEMQDLSDRNLLGYLNPKEGLVTNTWAANGGKFAVLALERIRPTGAGGQLVRLLSLTAMPEAEQEHVLTQLG